MRNCSKFHRIALDFQTVGSHYVFFFVCGYFNAKAAIILNEMRRGAVVMCCVASGVKSIFPQSSNSYCGTYLIPNIHFNGIGGVGVH